MKQKSNIPNTFYLTKHLTTQFRAAKEIFSFFFLSFFIYFIYFLFIYYLFIFPIYNLCPGRLLNSPQKSK